MGNNAWFKFFLGSPKRFLASAIVLLIIIAMLNPSLADRLMVRAFDSTLYVMQPVLILAFIVYLVKSIFSKGK